MDYLLYTSLITWNSSRFKVTRRWCGPSSDGVRGVVGRRRRLGDLRAVHGRDGVGLAGDDGGLGEVQLVARAAGGRQQPRGVQLDGVVVGRRGSRHRVVVWRLLLHCLLIRHRDYMDGIVNLEMRKHMVLLQDLQKIQSDFYKGLKFNYTTWLRNLSF